MKIKGSFVFLLISLTASLAGFSQNRPSNDNLTNAIVLTGTDVTFTGSLKGATLEDAADAAGDIVQGFYGTPAPTGSIWWSWTSPVSTVLNLEAQPFQFDGENALDVLTVYASTNGTANPAGLLQPPLGYMPLNATLVNQSLSVPVSAGSNYFIQLVGNSSNYNYNFRLLATDAPLIVKQPLSQTVYSNHSAIFYVISAGLPTRTYQWYFNGTPLSGETTPILALTNIDSSMVGNYSVLVSSSNASVMSDMVTLSISPYNIPPMLTAIGISSNTLSFSLAGETGRAYHIQSSSNLVDWAPENSFPIAPHAQIFSFYSWLGDLVFATNSALTLNVTGNSSYKFYRAFIFNTNCPDCEICINNLRQITVAKYLWYLDSHAFPEATPTFSNIAPYLRDTNLFCPLDTSKSFVTSYWIANLGTAPTCDLNPQAHHLDVVP